MTNRWLAFLSLPELRRSPKPKPAPRPASFEIAVGDRAVTVAVRRNPRAKRYTLRLDPRGEGAVVTVPRRGTLAEARAFAGRHVGWLAEKLADRAPLPIVAGALVPIRGVPHRIVATGSARGVVTAALGVDGRPELRVPGEPAHLARRVADHLKRQARADLAAAVARHAATLGVVPAALHLKDTTSRWGSASPRGTLSFSWRLIMAPPLVLDYLAAHEVAHLREMNHSDRFWALCRALAPETDAAKAWLAAHGRGLHRIG